MLTEFVHLYFLCFLLAASAVQNKKSKKIREKNRCENVSQPISGTKKFTYDIGTSGLFLPRQFLFVVFRSIWPFFGDAPCSFWL